MVFSLPVWVPTNSGLRSANEFLRYPFTDSISFFRVVAHTILENDFYILDVLDVFGRIALHNHDVHRSAVNPVRSIRSAFAGMSREPNCPSAAMRPSEITMAAEAA